VCTPRLLVLDEATSALDARSEAVVQAALDTIIHATSDHPAQRPPTVLVSSRAGWTLRARWVDAESSLGDTKSSLGDAESSLGDTKSSLGETLRARWVTLRARWVRR
jgi:hypothetical protein